MKEEQKLEQQPNSDSTAHIQQFSPTCPKPIVMCCDLSELKIGDKVRINHAHLYKDGYWQCWSDIDYYFIGKRGKDYHFKNVNYEREHFRMRKGIEDNHVFKGRLS